MVFRPNLGDWKRCSGVVSVHCVRQRLPYWMEEEVRLRAKVGGQPDVGFKGCSIFLWYA
jgi:hypothetical protein